jgi:hypothetical protein
MHVKDLRHFLIILILLLPVASRSQVSSSAVDVRTFGAVGDGVADDTKAIQAAIDAVGNGGTVEVPTGTYKLTNTIRMVHGASDDSSRVTLKCSGGRLATKFIWYGADQGNLIQIADSTHWGPVTVEGCGFQGADNSHKPVSIFIAFGNGHRVTDNYFGASTYHGVLATSSFTQSIDHNRFYGPWDSCIKFVSGASAVIDTIIDANEFGFCGASYTHGWALEQISQGGGGSNWLRITNNDCEGTEWNGCWYLKSVANPVMIGNRAEVDRSITDGSFQILTLEDTQGGYFAKNEFSGGVTLKGNSINNIFTGNNYYPNSTTGIAFASCCNGNISLHEPLLDRWVTGNLDRIGNPSDTWLRSGLNGYINIANPGDPSNTRKNYFMSMYTATGGNISGWGNATHLSGGRLPNAAAGSVYVAGDKLFDSYFPGNGWLGNLGWICVTATCSYNGTSWTGTWNYLSQSQCLEVDGTAAPATGQWKACDYVRNTNPIAGGVIGWRNIASGTPGTWQAVYDYNQALSSTSALPATAQFTSLELTASTGETPLKVSSRAPVANLTLADDSQVPIIVTPGKIMPAALPTPSANSIGGVQAKRCDGNSHVSSINTDGSIDCSAEKASSPTSRFLDMGNQIAPTFDALAADVFQLTLSDDVTKSNLINATPGQQLTFLICQDMTGGHSFHWPADFTGGMTLEFLPASATRSTCAVQSFIYNGALAFATGPGSLNTILPNSKLKKPQQPQW